MLICLWCPVFLVDLFFSFEERVFGLESWLLLCRGLVTCPLCVLLFVCLWCPSTTALCDGPYSSRCFVKFWGEVGVCVRLRWCSESCLEFWSPKRIKGPFVWFQLVVLPLFNGVYSQGYFYLCVSTMTTNILFFGAMYRFSHVSHLKWRNIRFESDLSSFKITFERGRF